MNLRCVDEPNCYVGLRKFLREDSLAGTSWAGRFYDAQFKNKETYVFPDTTKH